MIKEKSKLDMEIKTCFFFKIKQGIYGVKAAPLVTQVPLFKGFKNDFTYSGISLRCRGCRVFGCKTDAP